MQGQPTRADSSVLVAAAFDIVVNVELTGKNLKSLD